jgi:hypothetical protein
LTVRSIQLGLRVHHRTRTTIWANTHISHARVDSMSGDESLSLGRNGSEDTLLLESLAVGTATFWVLIESRAANLPITLGTMHPKNEGVSYCVRKTKRTTIVVEQLKDKNFLTGSKRMYQITLVRLTN